MLKNINETEGCIELKFKHLYDCYAHMDTTMNIYRERASVELYGHDHAYKEPLLNYMDTTMNIESLYWTT